MVHNTKYYTQTRANDLKGRLKKAPYSGHEDWIKYPYDKG